MGWMGPVVVDQQHEGWVVPVFADGAQGAGTTSARGVLVACRPDDGPRNGDRVRLGPVLAIFRRCDSRWWRWLVDMNSPMPRGRGSSRCCPEPGNGVAGGGITAR